MNLAEVYNEFREGKRITKESDITVNMRIHGNRFYIYDSDDDSEISCDTIGFSWIIANDLIIVED